MHGDFMYGDSFDGILTNTVCPTAIQGEFRKMTQQDVLVLVKRRTFGNMVQGINNKCFLNPFPKISLHVRQTIHLVRSQRLRRCFSLVGSVCLYICDHDTRTIPSNIRINVVVHKKMSKGSLALCV